MKLGFKNGVLKSSTGFALLGVMVLGSVVAYTTVVGIKRSVDRKVVIQNIKLDFPVF